MATVSLDRVRKVYPSGAVAVEGASFEIADGERVVLVGPSGCGKSTLLRMIAGLESITAGELRIGGTRMNEVAPKDRDIAMVFQSYALYPHMTVAENLGFALKLRGLSKAAITQRVAEAAAMLELGALLERKPAALSGGQRQRVALGRALVRHPQVFLLDEPLSNLDAKLRSGMRVEIARLHQRLGTTMVYVTHDQVEAMTLGQRIVVINQGQVQQIDVPMALYRRPANLFVAGFLGSPAMNLLRGRLVRADGLALVLDDGLRVTLPADAGVAEGWLQREVTLGVRPGDLQPSSSDPHLVGEVEVVEAIGSETFVNLRCGAHPLVARLAPQVAVEPGQRLGLRLAPGALHWFDTVSGQRLSPAGEATVCGD